MRYIIFLVSAFWSLSSCQQIASTKKKSYISNFDLTWNQIPTKWEEGAFLGNGRLGVTVWADSPNALRFNIGDSRIYNKSSRTPIGKFVFETNDTIADFKMHQSLEKAEVTGSFNTTKGEIKFSSFIDATQDIVRIRINTNHNDSLTIKHVPLPGIESDKLFKYLSINKANFNLKKILDYTEPIVYKAIYKARFIQELPEENSGKIKNINYRKVPFNKNSGYILLWSLEKNNTQTTLSYTTHFYQKAIEGNTDKAIEKFISLSEISYNKAYAKHIASWKEHMSASYISIPDKKVEANFWIQLHKIRAATRKGELPLDNIGPWFRATPWPRIWTNLNVQISYPIMNQINMYDIANTLFTHIDCNNSHFIKAVPEEYQDNSASIGRGWAPYEGTAFWGEYGNFLWLLFNYSQFLEHYPDDIRQKTKYYPLLKRGINFVVEHLEKDKNNIYHVPADISPEYKINGKIPEIEDNSYNLGLLKWSLQEAIHLAKKYNDNSAEAKNYENVLTNLTPLNIDKETGIMVGKNYKMDVCHRHFSHLIAYYPLAVLDVSDADIKQLCEKSVTHWITRPHSDWGFKGYSFTGATAMYARLQQADKALEMLHTYLNDYSFPNTLYTETGPVIETPLHSASATLELLLQSYSSRFDIDEIKLFSTIPQIWKDASFSKLRAEGGHMVSATLKSGHLTGAYIESTEERKVRITLPKTENNFSYQTKLGSLLKVSTDDSQVIIEGILKKGETLLIGNSTSHKTHQIKVKGIDSDEYHFGLN
jgi:hypothetical protein